MSRLDIDDLDIYNLSMIVGDEVWHVVLGWDNFEKNSDAPHNLRDTRIN